MKVLMSLILVLFCASGLSAQFNLPKVDTKKAEAQAADAKAKSGEAAKKADSDLDAGGKELTRQLKNVQNEKGPIVFKVGKAELDVAKCEKTLKAVGVIIRTFPGYRVQVDGHTDNVGSAKANKSLSQKRAEAVRTYLISTEKIPAARLSAKGFGSSQPIADNKTKEGRNKNRRVDFTVTKL